MVPLSQTEQQQADIMAKRLYSFIDAMDEGNIRLRRLCSKDEILALHQKVTSSTNVIGPDAQGNLPTHDCRPDVKDLGDYVQHMGEKIQYHSNRDTPEDAMWMVFYGNAASSSMDSHLSYNYQRLYPTVIKKMSQLHKDGLQLKIARGDLKARGADPNIISIKPDDCDVFRPSDSARHQCQPIKFDDLERSSIDVLLDHIFFVKADAMYVQCAADNAAFEVLGRKEGGEGCFYEIRWEGSACPIDIHSDELQLLAEDGFWMSSI